MPTSLILETIQFTSLLAFGAWLLWLSGRRAAEKRADQLARLRMLLDRLDASDLNESLKTSSGQEFLRKLVAEVEPPEVIETNASRRAVVVGSIGMGCIIVFATIMALSGGGAPPYMGGVPADLLFGAAGGLLLFTAGGILLSIRIIKSRTIPNQRESE